VGLLGNIVLVHQAVGLLPEHIGRQGGSLGGGDFAPKDLSSLELSENELEALQVELVLEATCTACTAGR